MTPTRHLAFHTLSPVTCLPSRRWAAPRNSFLASITQLVLGIEGDLGIPQFYLSLLVCFFARLSVFCVPFSPFFSYFHHFSSFFFLTSPLSATCAPSFVFIYSVCLSCFTLFFPVSFPCFHHLSFSLHFSLLHSCHFYSFITLLSPPNPPISLIFHTPLVDSFPPVSLIRIRPFLSFPNFSSFLLLPSSGFTIPSVLYNLLRFHLPLLSL